MEEQGWLEHPHILGDHPLGIISSGKIKATSYLSGRGRGSEDTLRWYVGSSSWHSLSLSILSLMHSL